MTNERIHDHLGRVKEFGVSLPEYAEAYGVELEALQSAQAALSAFVPVTVIDETPAATGMVCRLVHGDGWTLECQSWPPASWLRSLSTSS